MHNWRHTSEEDKLRGIIYVLCNVIPMRDQAHICTSSRYYMAPINLAPINLTPINLASHLLMPSSSRAPSLPLCVHWYTCHAHVQPTSTIINIPTSVLQSFYSTTGESPQRAPILWQHTARQDSMEQLPGAHGDPIYGSGMHPSDFPSQLFEHCLYLPACKHTYI